MAFVGKALVYTVRVNLSVAIICMTRSDVTTDVMNNATYNATYNAMYSVKHPVTTNSTTAAPMALLQVADSSNGGNVRLTRVVRLATNSVKFDRYRYFLRSFAFDTAWSIPGNL